MLQERTMQKLKVTDNTIKWKNLDDKNAENTDKQARSPSKFDE
jgi:hypothetical protein